MLQRGQWPVSQPGGTYDLFHMSTSTFTLNPQSLSALTIKAKIQPGDNVLIVRTESLPNLHSRLILLFRRESVAASPSSLYSSA